MKEVVHLSFAHRSKQVRKVLVWLVVRWMYIMYSVKNVTKREIGRQLVKDLEDRWRMQKEWAKELVNKKQMDKDKVWERLVYGELVKRFIDPG